MTGEELAAKLTAKQRAFANAIAAGAGGSEAYRIAYNTKGRDKDHASKASKLRRLPHVAAYITHLISKQERRRELNRERKRELLAEAAEDTKAKWPERIKAIEVDNVMTGDNAPEQVNVFGLGDLLQLVRKGNR